MYHHGERCTLICHEVGVTFVKMTVLSLTKKQTADTTDPHNAFCKYLLTYYKHILINYFLNITQENENILQDNIKNLHCWIKSHFIAAFRHERLRGRDYGWKSKLMSFSVLGICRFDTRISGK